MRDSRELEAACEAAWPKLVGTFGLYLGDRDLAEEVAQETLLRLCKHWRKVSQLNAPDAWMYQVAMNLAKSHIRRAVRRRRIDESTRLAPTEDADTAMALAVRDAVASLPERQRATLVLRYFADLSVAETAEALGCAQGTVKAATSAALENLRHLGLVDPPATRHEVNDESF